MLIIATGVYRNETWHVGESKTVFIRFKASSEPLTISADGDELEYILSQFSNIPVSKNPVIVWRGEVARFILDNL